MQIDVVKVRQYAEAYGVAVRAGVITPNKDDEAHLRTLFGLPPMNEQVLSAWEDNGVRAPITLAKELQEAQGATEETGQTDNL